MAEDTNMIQRVMSPTGYHGAGGSMSPYSLGPPAALTRARCRACGDFVVGYVLNCTICDSEVHAHCMTPYQGHPVCHACHAERDYMMAQRQAAWSGHLAQQVARTAASGA